MNLLGAEDVDNVVADCAVSVGRRKHRLGSAPNVVRENEYTRAEKNATIHIAQGGKSQV